MFTDGVIKTITGANKDPHFTDTLANRSGITEITGNGPVKAFSNGKDSLAVSQLLEPFVKHFRLFDFVSHIDIVANKLQYVKARMKK